MLWLPNTGATGKGFIFVEAPKKDHVTQALQGLGNSSNGLNPYSARVVPINQMIQAVTVSTDHVLLKPRDFVRIKRGLYKGDPGMVVGTSDHGTQVMVKLVPRLDLVELEMQQDQNVLAEKPKRGVSFFFSLFGRVNFDSDQHSSPSFPPFLAAV